MRNGADCILGLGRDGELLAPTGEPWRPEGPWLAVVGDPIVHSLSPAIHNAALAAAGLPSRYYAVRVPRGSLDRLKSAVANTGLIGLNVTAPLKAEAASLCAELSEAAGTVGAVNTVGLRGGRWSGHNTDIAGIASELRALLPDPEAALSAVVLGTGGSARAAVAALASLPAARIEVRGRAGGSLAEFAGWAGRAFPAVGVGDWRREPPAADVCLCCVPGGADVRGRIPAAPAGRPALLLDLGYGGRPRPAPPGVNAVDGRGVLVAQAALSFVWWFDRPAPAEAMRAAAGLS